ncbi:MAG: hypothetical protein P1U34_00085 [Coxiellaceae bacterium]|nr:hypothetical protein [Coxiellaceae bacterium]
MSRALPEGAKLSARFKKSRDEAESECKTREAPAESSVSIRSSGHTTSVNYKVPKSTDKPISPWLNKTLGFPWAAAVEVAVTQMHRRINLRTIPKARVIYDAADATAETGDTDTDASSVATSVGLGSPVRRAHSITGGSSKCAVKLFSNFEDLTAFLDATTPLTEEKCAFLQRVHGVNLVEFGCLTPLQQQIQFLVYCGLGEALAMAYFFEEEDCHRGNLAIVYDEETLPTGEVVKNYRVVSIDFDHSAFGLVGRDEWLGPRKALGVTVHADAHSSYKVHLEDVENFPDLKHQDPWYWPTIYRTISSVNGYSEAVTEAMKALKHDEFFRRQVFATWAQIALTDVSHWKQDIERHMPEFDNGGALGRQLHEHFSGRRLALIKTLVQSPAYNEWWYALDKPQVKQLFDHIARYNRELKPRWKHHATHLELAKQHYLLLGCNIAKRSFEQGIFYLERLLQGMPTLRRDASGDPLARHMIDKAYEALWTIRQVFHERYKPLFDLAKKKLKSDGGGMQDISPEDVDQFVVLSHNTLKDVLDVCGKRVNGSGQVSAKRSTTELQLTDELNTDLLEMTRHFSRGIHNLRRCQYVIGGPKPSLSDSRFGVASIYYRPEEAEFVLVSRRATKNQLLAALIEMTLARLQQDTNKPAIIGAYYKHMLRHNTLNSGVIAGAYRLFGSYYAGKSPYVVRADYGRLQASESGLGLAEELNHTLSVGEWTANSFNTKFVLDLLRQQQRIISYSNAVGQVRHGLVRAELACLDLPVIANDAVAAQAFQVALRHAIEERLYAGITTGPSGEGDWQEVASSGGSRAGAGIR